MKLSHSNVREVRRSDSTSEYACGVSSPHRQTTPQAICGYCVSIFTFQMQKLREKQKQKHWQVEFTSELWAAASVERKAQKRATADKNMRRKM